MRCESCGTENPTGQRFCGHCGAALALICGSCGATNQPSQKYCGACGTSLVGAYEDAASAAAVPRAAPTTERRLVSVLFADLVGFTTFSESRDSEEVRDLLSRYFDASRQIVGRYGGIVEKFIGDAVSTDSRTAAPAMRRALRVRSRGAREILRGFGTVP